MKTLFYPLFAILLLLGTSCEKEIIIQNPSIHGDWVFVEAVEVDDYGHSINILCDYHNAVISFLEDEYFVWHEDNLDYEGDYFQIRNKLTLQFYNGDMEEWLDFNYNHHNETITFVMHTHDHYELLFTLKRIVL